MFEHLDFVNLLEFIMMIVTTTAASVGAYYAGRSADRMSLQFSHFKDEMLKEIKSEFLGRDFLALYDVKHESLRRRVDEHDVALDDIRSKCEERIELHRKLAGK